MGTTDALLKQPFAEAKFSEGFIETCNRMGLITLEDVLQMKPADLIRQKDFTFHWLSELVSYLESRQALYLLQKLPAPGNISG